MSVFAPLRPYAALLAVLAGLLVLFGTLSDYFLTPITLRTLAGQIPPLVVVSVGMTFVLIIAGIDLSVGAVVGLSSAVLGVLLLQAGWPLPLSIAGAMLAGAGCGAINGLVSVRWRIPSFIVTLGMLEMARGGAYLVTNSQTQYAGTSAQALSATVLGLPLSFWMAAVVVVLAQITLTRTVFGRHMLATGSNREATRLAGVQPGRIEFMVFVIAGLLSALGGVFQVGYLGSADPNAGIGMELAAIAAVVIGGTSLMGGQGSVVATFLGVLIIAVLQLGLAQLGVSEPLKRVVTGGVIVLAVIADVYRRKQA
ncbi:MAG: ABC transporter permease [Rhodothermales bacterium]